MIVELILGFISHVTSVCSENFNVQIFLFCTPHNFSNTRSVLNIAPSYQAGLCENKAYQKSLLNKNITEIKVWTSLFVARIIYLIGDCIGQDLTCKYKNICISVTTHAWAINGNSYFWRNKKGKTPSRPLSIFWQPHCKAIPQRTGRRRVHYMQKRPKVQCMFLCFWFQWRKGCYFFI